MATKIANDTDYNVNIGTNEEQWYYVFFSDNGNANFYINPNVSTLNIDLYVYDSNQTTLLKSSTSGGVGKFELIENFPVTKDKTYYIKIKAYSSGQYLLRCKNYIVNKELNMPGCHNQRYITYSFNFNKYCCGACSVAHIAEYYRKYAYSSNSLETDLKTAKVISNTYYGAVWANCPSGKIGSEKSVSSNSNLYSLIKSEIDENRPVIIKQTGTSGRQHYVVAYKYINSAKTDSDIFVLDSANLRDGTKSYKKNPDNQNEQIEVTTASNGQRISLYSSASYNSCPTYSSYMLTSSY